MRVGVTSVARGDCNHKTLWELAKQWDWVAEQADLGGGKQLIAMTLTQIPAANNGVSRQRMR